MILLTFAIAGVVFGLLFGGRFCRCAEYPLKGLILPVIALLMKAGASYLLQPQDGAILVGIVQYALIFGFLLLNINRGAWPLIVIFGSFLNSLVILLNGGCMPVSDALLVEGSIRAQQLAAGGIYAYSLMTPHTVLPFLGDVIRIGPRGVPFGFASVGDLLIGIGTALLFFQMMRYDAPQKEQQR
jgi:hypothetical protein